ncbi:enoyl-CoA hydratase [Cavenderia fasciculata]|uniref:Enoyl-CoA hydratase n=1 Tax=Cavenderia fasciculata TaxID=261658 RepID=F4PV24_CACFS|nr:enoyl-CoA hydratase [Cavenderia fasciculata]EGG21140.1 enoyl-CoA hydratase [Cavenderia fasciculata]|eukprot:XP_004358990.1 enoyl-CoA hydratase [Cavenderia fasciculata]
MFLVKSSIPKFAVRLYSTTAAATAGAAKEPLVFIEKHLENGVYNGVSFLKLNKPAHLNALTFDMGKDFKDCVDQLAQDKSVKCVILTGAGKAFSAGGDLNFLMDRTKDSPQNNAVIMEKFYKTYLYIRNINVPIISAINGPAIGAGLCLAMATDIRLASNKAKMGLTFVSLGISPGMGSTHFLPRVVSHQVATRMLLTGDVVQGDEAKQLGLVLDVYNQEDLIPQATALASRIAKQSAISVQGCLKSIRNQQNTGLEVSLQREADNQSQCFAHPDIVEGLTAIKESRPPVFKS